MKKRTTKETTKVQRRYESGLLMYRERKNLLTIPANTMVEVIKHGPKHTLVALSKNFNELTKTSKIPIWVILPNDSLPKIRDAKPARTHKATAATVESAPVVDTAPAAVEAQQPAAEIQPEAQPVIEQPAQPVAEQAPAEQPAAEVPAEVEPVAV